jgi:hypothetical protein
VNAAVKVAGMAGGADSIDDLDLLRHGAMPALFGEVRAPSTLGSFLRAFTWGNVLQLGKASRRLLAELTRRAPLLPGKDTLAFIDIDSQQKRVYGRKKQGVAAAPSEIRVAVDLRSMTDNHADNTDLHPDRELRLRPGPRACVTPPGPASSTETGTRSLPRAERPDPQMGLQDTRQVPRHPPPGLDGTSLRKPTLHLRGHHR